MRIEVVSDTHDHLRKLGVLQLASLEVEWLRF